MKKPLADQLLENTKQILALAEIGIHFAHNEFDLKRYHEILRIGLTLSEKLTGVSDVELLETSVELNGYKTPKVDVRAVMFNTREEILLVKEKMDGKWSLPGGWADVGQTPSEVAVKEALEEAGAEVIPIRIMAIMDKRCHPHPADIYYIYKIFIECQLVRLDRPDLLETSEAGFFSMDDLPPLSLPRNTEEQLRLLLKMKLENIREPYFD